MNLYMVERSGAPAPEAQGGGDKIVSLPPKGPKRKTKSRRRSWSTTEFLWRELLRNDALLAAVNGKSTLFVAENTFVVGAITVKFADLLPTFGATRFSVALAAAMFAIVAGASLVSLFYTLLAVKPYLKSPDKAGIGSKIYFKRIAQYSPEDFLTELERMDSSQLRLDLAGQVCALSKALDSKHSWLGRAAAAILWVQFPALAVLVVLKILLVLSSL